jgi:hypothetical protein
MGHMAVTYVLPRRKRKKPGSAGDAAGMREGQAPDRFLAGPAVLNLLSAMAEDQPAACLVDDVRFSTPATSPWKPTPKKSLHSSPLAPGAAIEIVDI